MPRGGARPGAGRKKGTPTRSTVEAREQSLRIVGSTPLDVMLWAIARCVEADEYKDAGDLAAKAAPYMHPKLASQDAKTVNIGGIPDRLSAIPTQEVERRILHLLAPEAANDVR